MGREKTERMRSVGGAGPRGGDHGSRSSFLLVFLVEKRREGGRDIKIG